MRRKKMIKKHAIPIVTHKKMNHCIILFFLMVKTRKAYNLVMQFFRVIIIQPKCSIIANNEPNAGSQDLDNFNHVRTPHNQIKSLNFPTKTLNKFEHPIQCDSTRHLIKSRR